MSIKIVHVKETSSELKRFHSLQTKIAARYPFTNQRPLSHLKRQLSQPAHISQQTVLLAEQEGQTQAKLLARCLPADDAGNKAIGLIGYYDSLENSKASKTLLTAACEWLQKHDVTKIIGPMNGANWYDYRFAIGPFGQRPFLLEPNNPDYYPELWEDFGFTSHSDYYSRHLDDISKLLPRLREHYSHALSQGFTFRPLQFNQFKRDIAKLYRLWQLATASDALQHRVPLMQLYSHFLQLKPLIDKGLIHFVCNTNGEEVGFIFSVPDHFTAQQIQAKSPRRLLAYHLAKRNTQALNVYAIGILPEYHREGLASALNYMSYQTALNNGLTQANFCLLQEGNPVDKINKASGTVSQRYRLYQYEI